MQPRLLLITGILHYPVLKVCAQLEKAVILRGGASKAIQEIGVLLKREMTKKKIRKTSIQ